MSVVRFGMVQSVKLLLFEKEQHVKLLGGVNVYVALNALLKERLHAVVVDIDINQFVGFLHYHP